MKHEWRKQEKALYLPKGKPEEIVVPCQKFFMVKGKGDPNKAEFAEKIGVLYSLAYAVKMMPKTGFVPEGYIEYTVYPLEALWQMDEGEETGNAKDGYIYTLMVRQPDFVTQELAERVFEQVKRKKPHPFLAEAFFEKEEDGLSVQMMHAGAYDEEHQSFLLMNDFLRTNALKRRNDIHREIYVTQVNREHPEKQKTVLRYSVMPV